MHFHGVGGVSALWEIPRIDVLVRSGQRDDRTNLNIKSSETTCFGTLLIFC